MAVKDMFGPGIGASSNNFIVTRGLNSGAAVTITGPPNVFRRRRNRISRLAVWLALWGI